MIDTHAKKRKKSIRNTKDDYQITRVENKRRRRKKELQNNSQTINKMTVSTYLSIITLHGLNALIRRHGVLEWLQKQDQHMLPTRDSLQIYRHTQTEC